MLGAIDQTFLLQLLEALAAGDAAGVAAIAADMQSRSLSFDGALADLAALLLNVALAQSVPDALAQDLPERARIVALGQRLDAESVQLYYQIALQGREDLPLAPDEHAGFLMTLLRMIAFRPDAGGGEKKPAPAPTRKSAPARGDESWPQLVQQLPVSGAARELARNAELRRRDGSLFELTVSKAKAHLAERAYQDKLKAALEQHLGGAVTIRVSVGEVTGATTAGIEAGEREAARAAASQAVQSDGFVKDLVNLFDAKVVDSTIRREGK